MNILFTVCGRAGSKGVKGKNISNFLNAPLVWYSLSAIALYIEKHAKTEDNIDVVVNTDSEDLMRIVDEVKALKVIKFGRDKSLAGDRVPKVSVIFDCLKRAEIFFTRSYDVVVDLDITSPLRTIGDIKNAIDKKVSRPEVDVVYSVTHSRRNPYFNMVREEKGFFYQAIPSCFTARQEAPVFYDMNASIYAYSVDALKEKDHPTFFNSKCDAILMDDTGILDIDSEEDFLLMQVIAQYLFNNIDKYKEIYQRVISWK